MKNRSLLAKRLNIFYDNIESKRNGKRMRLQTDLEFQQNKAKELNKKFDVEMFIQNLVVEKHLLQNKRLQNLKKKLLRSKSFEKLKKKRIKPNELIKKAMQNINETISTKNGFAPETIEN